ncbi:MAG: formylglycine-generating enzyme family protein [Magnetococcales bacterium]|nr:formylglycine-generating enzyme family protein [Magnetococcales bacterium]
MSIDIDGDKGKAKIDYDRLASTSEVGIFRRIFVDRKEHDIVELNLQRYDNKWLVVDPPTWRISIDKVPSGYDYYELENRFAPPERPENPKSVDYREIDDYQILKHLKKYRHDKPPSTDAIPGRCGKGSPIPPPAPILPDEKWDGSDPRQVVQRFVGLEFKGDGSLRRHLAILSGSGGELPETQDAREDELIVVSRYNIQHVRTEGDQGIAEVDYDRLLSTRRIGNSRRLFPDDWEREHDQVTLKLQRRDGAWFVVDPPPWRISLEKIFAVYQKEFQPTDEIPDWPNPESCAFQIADDYSILKFYRQHPPEVPEDAAWIQKSNELASKRRKGERDKLAWERVAGEVRTANLQELSPDGSRSWRDPVTGLEFVWVPGGTFGMGCGSWVEECYDDERPLHLVTLKGFWLAKYEVTEAQWRAVMGRNPTEESQEGSPEDNANYDNDPVDVLSWIDVVEFIAKLNMNSDGKFRLPTEAEWEYACRSGGREEKYSGGMDLNAVAWTAGSDDGGWHPVGTKQANGLGLHDMSGNAQEWVQDRYDEKAYTRHSRFNPLTTHGNRMAKRGNSASIGGGRLHRCVYRSFDDPQTEAYPGAGIRLARSP